MGDLAWMVAVAGGAWIAVSLFLLAIQRSSHPTGTAGRPPLGCRQGRAPDAPPERLPPAAGLDDAEWESIVTLYHMGVAPYTLSRLLCLRRAVRQQGDPALDCDMALVTAALHACTP